MLNLMKPKKETDFMAYITQQTLNRFQRTVLPTKRGKQ
ncbi:hypothetical protein M101_4155 [Bacteroides fragilis str. 1007-1-F |nr:hypothetical protein M101_4155 [Bacteroides fragilis str. 1007-1-F \